MRFTFTFILSDLDNTNLLTNVFHLGRIYFYYLICCGFLSKTTEWWFFQEQLTDILKEKKIKAY